MDLALTGHVALVTGATRGLGLACARLLASEGANLFLTGRDPDLLDDAANQLRGSGRQVMYQAADLTDPAAAEQVAAAALAQFSRIHILVNCAGASQGGLFWEIPDQVWEDSLALKFMGTLRMIRAALPSMREHGYGRIVNVVGNTGKQPGARLLPGSTANAALLALTRGLANEVASEGITLNAVNPGPTRTERWTNMMNSFAGSSGQTPAEIEQTFMDQVPSGRLAEPEEIARMVVFLASPHAAHITGTSITADGGATQALA
jgi:3-oxoacyl-[acyl-carrier protein] reductase